MQLCKTKQCIMLLPILAMLVTFTNLGFPLGEIRYAYSQSTQTNSSASSNPAAAGVDLKDIHPSPLKLKAGSKFEIFSTVVNNSPRTIMFTAGACQSPLSAQFMRNVVIKYTQGCTATSPPFKLNSGQEVSVAGPSSDTIYQAISAGKTTATATFITKQKMDRPQTLQSHSYLQ
jgi:hypothetical protein